VLAQLSQRLRVELAEATLQQAQQQRLEGLVASFAFGRLDRGLHVSVVS